jgi:FkbM family methyltransferase
MMPVNGWYLPKGDQYFAPFCENTSAPKRNGFQREHLLEAFKYVRNWRVAIDVGAHVGFWTCDMAEKFDAVFAFEPAADTYACLVKNTEDLANVVCTPSAVGDEVGCCIMRDPNGVNTGARYAVKAPGGVPMVTLDSCKFPFCDLLKVDVEGFELQVLQGAEQLIEEHEPAIIMECDKHFSLRRYRVDRGAAPQFLKDRGYEQVARMRPDRVFVHRG